MNKRGFKFKIWSYELNKWVTDLFLDNLSETKFTTLNGFFNDLENNNSIEILQYANIQDNTGKDIYEGDIISYDGRIGRVEFDACQFYVMWNDQTEDELGQLYLDRLNMVGNLFETPQLVDR